MKVIGNLGSLPPGSVLDKGVWKMLSLVARKDGGSWSIVLREPNGEIGGPVLATADRCFGDKASLVEWVRESTGAEPGQFSLFAQFRKDGGLVSLVKEEPT
jgi:hypothetical protein